MNAGRVFHFPSIPSPSVKREIGPVGANPNVPLLSLTQQQQLEQARKEVLGRVEEKIRREEIKDAVSAFCCAWFVLC